MIERILLVDIELDQNTSRHGSRFCAGKNGQWVFLTKCCGSIWIIWIWDKTAQPETRRWSSSSTIFTKFWLKEIFADQPGRYQRVAGQGECYSEKNHPIRLQSGSDWDQIKFYFTVYRLRCLARPELFSAQKISPNRWSWIPGSERPVQI